MLPARRLTGFIFWHLSACSNISQLASEFHEKESLQMHIKGLAFLVLIVMLLWAVPALGQVDVASATLKGTITDQHDALVPGATVTATSIDKGISRTAKTGTDGTYQIPVLPPGAYKVEIEAPGFSKVVNENVRLSIGQSLVYDVQLSTGG